MSLVEVDPRTDLRWARLLEQQRSDVFHAPGWLRVLGETYSLDVRALLGLDEAGQPTAGIAFCRIEDFLGERIVSLPFSDYCDPLVEHPEAARQLLGQLIAAGRLVTLRCLHNHLPLADRRLAVA